MLQVPETRLLPRRGLLQRRSIQLVGGLALAALLPWAARMSVLGWAGNTVVTASAIGSAWAVLLGYYVYRSVASYPGTLPGFYILPAFAAAYAAVLAGFVLLRLDYSRFVFLFGFTVSSAWYLLVFVFNMRTRAMVIGVVPFGDYRSLLDVPGFDWPVLARATEPLEVPYDAIVADFRADLPDEWDRALATCALRGIPTYHTKQLRESITGRVEIEHLSENSLGSLIPLSVYKRIKGTADFTAALVAVIALAAPMLILAAAIRLDSPGPALFKQKRVGRGGTTFEIFKFRTMRVEEPRHDGPSRAHAMTQNDDPRVTRLGRFLRRNRIDELAQIINILRGEMSWIGPRPEALVLSEWYQNELPFYSYRHIVKPGITGWAQVRQGHVTEVDSVLEKLHYDFYYVKNFSPWLDIVIVFLTIRTMLTGFGSR